MSYATTTFELIRTAYEWDGKAATALHGADAPNFVVLFCRFLSCVGDHTVTGMLMASGCRQCGTTTEPTDSSRRRWCVDELGLAISDLIIRHFVTAGEILDWLSMVRCSSAYLLSGLRHAGSIPIPSPKNAGAWLLVLVEGKCLRRQAIA